MAYYDTGTPTKSVVRIVMLGALGVALLVLLVLSGRMVEFVSASDVVLIQFPSGTMVVHTSPGPKAQWMGTVTTYPKRGIIRFAATRTEGENGAVVWTNDNRLPVQFNDGGKGKVLGSMNYELSAVPAQLIELHSKYPTVEALESGLIQSALNKTIYMTGQLMSSHESYQARRTQLIQYVEDQVQNGVYLTRVRQQEVKDDAGGTRTVMVAEILTGPNALPQRAETGQLARFGIRAFNFAIEDLDYEDAVDKQITQQQGIVMAVQTAIAEATRAEQNKRTIEAQGAAEAAKAKWEQEVIKAKQVTEAESRLQVQTLANQEAEQYRQATLKRAEADSGYRRQVMQADGALEKKLDAYIRVNQMYADAIKNYKGNWVPNVSMGGGSGNNAAVTLTDLLTAQAAKQLGVQVTP